jgi:hypothetical protein
VDYREAMSDPVESWLMKYIGVVATAAFSGMGAAMGWFRQHRIGLLKEVASAKATADERFEHLESELRALHEHNTRQDLALQKLEIQQRYHEDKIEALSEATNRRR